VTEFKWYTPHARRPLKMPWGLWMVKQAAAYLADRYHDAPTGSIEERDIHSAMVELGDVERRHKVWKRQPYIRGKR
jgi:hypothetical protein